MLNKFLYPIAFIAIFLRCPALFAQSPSVETITTGTKTSLRGLSVVNDNVVWVSGSNGMVGKSLNGGKNWNWMTVKGFEKVEFRDIEAFDASTAVIMGVDAPAYILKTTDGGETWKVVYENKAKGMFLDAMDFAGDKYGMVVGDPISNQPFIIETADGGNSWVLQSLPGKRPAVDSGEAFFAASGTNIRYFNRSDYYVVSGGTKSNLITANSKKILPLVQGRETTGANSLDIYDLKNTKKRMIVVGGDFNTPDATEKNCFYSGNGGNTWKAPKVPPHGYRSCVEYLSDKAILCCGLNGVDYSKNGGNTWHWISKESFNICRIAKTGKTVYLAGNKGTVAKITWR